MSQNTLLIIPSPYGDVHVFIDITVLLTFSIVKQHWAEIIRDEYYPIPFFRYYDYLCFSTVINGNKWKTREIRRKKNPL